MAITSSFIIIQTTTEDITKDCLNTVKNYVQYNQILY